MLVGAKWDEALKILQAARLQSEKHNAKATQVCSPYLRVSFLLADFMV